MKKELPVIDVPASGKKTWFGGAFTLTFVYSKKGNFILRGYIDEVKEYLEKNHTHYFANFTLYHNGKSRNIWDFWKDNVSIYKNTIVRGRKEYKRGMKLTYLDQKTGERKKILFKRLPNRWIPEFNNL